MLLFFAAIMFVFSLATIHPYLNLSWERLLNRYIIRHTRMCLVVGSQLHTYEPTQLSEVCDSKKIHIILFLSILFINGSTEHRRTYVTIWQSLLTTNMYIVLYIVLFTVCNFVSLFWWYQKKNFLYLFWNKHNHTQTHTTHIYTNNLFQRF